MCAVEQRNNKQIYLTETGRILGVLIRKFKRTVIGG